MIYASLEYFYCLVYILSSATTKNYYDYVNLFAMCIRAVSCQDKIFEREAHYFITESR